MKSKLLSLLLVLFSLNINSQVISMIGSTSPSGSWTIDTVMETTDNITYTLNNVTLTTATDPATTGLKFRQDGQWTTNWGNSNFPSGTATLNGPNIMTIAGTYNVTFNRINGTYTFISTSYPIIGIWGPAVDAQNGYAGDDVEMQTTDGITYTLGDYFFTSGNAYFRQDNNNMLVYGVIAFPSGTAVENGPPIFIPGGEYFVTFNRITGEFNFEFPRVGILGSALGGFGVADTDLTTSNGFDYSISNLTMINGAVKFRKNDDWSTNWGAIDFPTGIGFQNGPDIPVGAGTYNVVFERTSGNYSFVNVLSNNNFSLKTVTIAPNPTTWNWTIQSEQVIDTAELFDITGKSIQSYEPKQNNFSIDGSQLSHGTYFIKLVSGLNAMVQKIVKN
jgi:starch-binding outer membrane protein SusE/F